MEDVLYAMGFRQAAVCLLVQICVSSSAGVGIVQQVIDALQGTPDLATVAAYHADRIVNPPAGSWMILGKHHISHVLLLSITCSVIHIKLLTNYLLVHTVYCREGIEYISWGLCRERADWTAFDYSHTFIQALV